MHDFITYVNSIYSFISGPSSVAMALIMYFQKSREFIARHNVVNVAILATAAAMFGLYAYAWFAPRGGQPIETFHNCVFRNEVVILDDRSYSFCKFYNVTLQYDGGDVRFNDNFLDGFRMKSNNKAINGAFVLMGKLDMLKSGVVDRNGNVVSPEVTRVPARAE